ncbi:atherin-like [Cricetulus griseus]|uniref:Atherin-like n=1 Tax=Cricetulus griseus TaxID=10029 RepID=A0A9J7FAB3_CRIGR|nr:atherin-like [Cricetulus griseus]
MHPHWGSGTGPPRSRLPPRLPCQPPSRVPPAPLCRRPRSRSQGRERCGAAAPRCGQRPPAKPAGYPLLSHRARRQLRPAVVPPPPPPPPAFPPPPSLPPAAEARPVSAEPASCARLARSEGRAAGQGAGRPAGERRRGGGGPNARRLDATTSPRRIPRAPADEPQLAGLGMRTVPTERCAELCGHGCHLSQFLNHRQFLISHEEDT